MTPENKVQVVQTLENADVRTAMVGDGANDAAAIRAATVGIGVVSHGSDPAHLVADVVLVDGRIAALLAHEARATGVVLENPEGAAEHFLHLVVAAPQRRALLLGDPMTPDAREAWARDAVRLFLHGWSGQP